MTLSVVIPVFDTERYVGAAIDSVLAQRRRADEIIVVDDGSTDRTPEVLRGYGARIVALRQPQRGPAAALNTGLARARGDLVALLDADDLWHPDKLDRQCGALDAEPDLDAVFCRVSQFISPDAVEDCRNIVLPDTDQAGICKSAMLIRRRALDRIGPFDASLRHVDFLDWYARAVAAGLRHRMLDDVLAERRIHASNTGRRARDQQRAENLIALKRSLDRRRG